MISWQIRIFALPKISPPKKRPSTKFPRDNISSKAINIQLAANLREKVIKWFFWRLKNDVLFWRLKNPQVYLTTFTTKFNQM